MSDDDIDMASETSTIRTDLNGNVPQQVPFSTEAVNNLYNEKIKENSESKSQLIKTIEDANSMFEKSNVQQLSRSTEGTINIYEEKFRKITDLRSELINAIEDINNKFEEMKNFK